MGSLLFVSDIHSNLEALEAVLGAEPDMEVVSLGDAVGYGASPNEVLSTLRSVKARCILGNHDQAAVTGETSWFSPRAAMAALWTRKTLSEESASLIKSWPLTREVYVGDARVVCFHGSPDDPLREYVHPSSHRDVFPRMLANAGSPALALGHIHLPFVWRELEGVVFNPGSVGQPRDGDPRASYAVVSAAGGRLDVKLKRARYDVASAAARIMAAGLPRPLADRLSAGT